MDTETIRRILRRCKLACLFVVLKREIEAFPYLIHYLKGLIKVRMRKKLHMSFLYGDHMVLQCEENIPIRGEAMPGEWITVNIAGQEKETCSGSDGCWEVELQPLVAGGPYTLTIATRKKKLTYKDVYAGEVWLCSGQSNMVATIDSYLRDNKSEEGTIFENKYDLPFRCFCMDILKPPFPVKWNRWIIRCMNKYDCIWQTRGWNDCTEEVRYSLSAIAYFYGESLSRQLQKPIGLIVNPVGGTAEYCWVERRILQRECPEILTDWYKNQKVTAWMKERVIQNLGKQYSYREHLHFYYPGYCFEAFIRPVIGYGLKGVIWFSGESSAQLEDTDLFERLQELLIRSWREAWGKCFPFYYVQLHGMNYEQSFGRGRYYYYPEIRNAQRRLLKKVPYSGMAVSYDLSMINKVHFKNRKPVGERLARLALHGVYGRNDITPCGPLYHEASLRDNFIYIKFDWSEGLCLRDGGEPKTFEVAGKDRCFYPAKAWIEGNEVVLSCPEVPDPCWVRYAFSEYPAEANLVNGDGLPAASFEERIDSINR